jgi:hypothetical protein
MLRRLPIHLRDADSVHFHGGKHNGELRQALRGWFCKASALQPAASPKQKPPPKADLAVLIPRCEIAPLALAQYLLSPVPFVLLCPVDLLTMAYSPKLYPQAPHVLLEQKFQKAGKITLLETQMTWIFDNIADCAPVETFANSLRTPAPVTGFTVDGHIDPSVEDDDAADEVEGTLPRTLEAWIRAQERDDQFEVTLQDIADKACRQGLWIHAPSGQNPRIIVP